MAIFKPCWWRAWFFHNALPALVFAACWQALIGLGAHAIERAHHVDSASITPPATQAGILFDLLTAVILPPVHPVIRWFHQLGSPPYFDRFAATWAPRAWVIALVIMAIGIYGALFVVPPDYQQLDSYRILYIHVPSAWMSLLVYALMALYAAIAMIWRIKLCEILAMACAPIGAGFTVITLATGMIWGKPMWGTWWDWDPRLTSQLVLLFMYLGVIGLYNAIEDRRSAARAAGLLAIVGVVLLPIIRYSVVWWNSLHQGQTIRVFGESSIDSSMVWPLIVMVIGTKFWFAGALLNRARADNLRREAMKDWVAQRANAGVK